MAAYLSILIYRVYVSLQLYMYSISVYSCTPLYNSCASRAWRRASFSEFASTRARVPEPCRANKRRNEWPAFTSRLCVGKNPLAPRIPALLEAGTVYPTNFAFSLRPTHLNQAVKAAYKTPHGRQRRSSNRIIGSSQFSQTAGFPMNRWNIYYTVLLWLLYTRNCIWKYSYCIIWHESARWEYSCLWNLTDVDFPKQLAFWQSDKNYYIDDINCKAYIRIVWGGPRIIRPPRQRFSPRLTIDYRLSITTFNFT